MSYDPETDPEPYDELKGTCKRHLYQTVPCEMCAEERTARKVQDRKTAHRVQAVRRQPQRPLRITRSRMNKV